MKQFDVIGFDKMLSDQEPSGLKKLIIFGDERMTVSDGYHTIDELYDHRNALFIALCRQFARFSVQSYLPWRSLKHSDGSDSFGGWFLLGIGKDKGDQITYHVPMMYWNQTSFCETLEQAPEWDGHTSNDVLERISKL